MDPLDLRIVEALLDRERTIHQLSKEFYQTNDQHDLRGHNSTLRYHVRKLAEDGLVRKREGRHGPYYVPLDELTHGHAVLVVRGGGGRVELDMGKVLYVERNGQRRLVFLE